jgi:hypothetical protein
MEGGLNLLKRLGIDLLALEACTGAGGPSTST